MGCTMDNKRIPTAPGAVQSKNDLKIGFFMTTSILRIFRYSVLFEGQPGTTLYRSLTVMSSVNLSFTVGTYLGTVVSNINRFVSC